MEEFKVGPKEVATLKRGILFHIPRFIFFIVLFHILFAASWVAGLYSKRIYRPDDLDSIPPMAPMLIPLSVLAFVGFSVLIYKMAKRDAYFWVAIEGDGLHLIERIGSSDRNLKKVRFDQMKFLTIGKVAGSLFSRSSSDAWVAIRYRSDQAPLGLDSIMTLGPKSPKEIENLKRILKKECANVKIFPNLPLE